MKEDFLHYVWKFQKFDGINFFTSNNEKLHVKHPGSHNFDSGPDFFNAQIEIGGQLWAGNLEIHIKSSDWYAHNHQVDIAYNNVILHVVWEHDTKVYRSDGSEIPTFIVKDYISVDTVTQYQKLFSKQKKWINCESDFPQVDSFILDNWLERLYLERLERKEIILNQELVSTQNHWESLLFRMLCKNFGLKVNGESFFSIAKSIDFSIIQKNSQNSIELEALLFGQATLLEDNVEDAYFQDIKNRYQYLKHKYSLSNEGVISPKFFRLRPPNFPTLRLSQLSIVYFKHKTLFSKVIEINKLEDIYELFNVGTTDYWDTHYNFGVPSSKRKKKITKKFINLLIINTLLPIKFCYARQQGKEVIEEVMSIAMQIPSEENSIIKKFNSLKKVSINSYHSQALLELKNEYCDKNQCLKCAIGNSILGSKKTLNPK